MAQEKKDREIAQHKQWADQEAHEVEFTKTHDFMTENPATEVSMLAPHRVKPYHFKGFNQGQIEQVRYERTQQVREANMMKQQLNEEDKLYAMQLESQRRQQILADRAMKRGLRNVQNEHREMQTLQAADKKEKWLDPYHEKDMAHTHVGNLKL